jgi:4-diphosphocytidyl-2-C-methyl-D-erythritol kinase
VGATLLERAPAKINLTLQVRGRRADGYHELESLVAFADFADTLKLQPAPEDRLEVTGPFAGISGPNAENLVLKACAALRDRFGGLTGGYFLLEKNIPVAAGLGGGSADAAAALRLMAHANGLSLDDDRFMSAARAVGADVPVCLDPRPRIMHGVGEVLSRPLDLPLLPAMLVNPGVPLATRDVFARMTIEQKTRSFGDIPREFDALIEFLKRDGNDLTPAASACAPVVAEVLDTLQSLPAVKLARMSGSGATCFALFRTPIEAAAAAQRLSEKKSWWLRTTSLGSGVAVS